MPRVRVCRYIIVYIMLPILRFIGWHKPKHIEQSIGVSYLSTVRSVLYGCGPSAIYRALHRFLTVEFMPTVMLVLTLRIDSRDLAIEHASFYFLLLYACTVVSWPFFSLFFKYDKTKETRIASIKTCTRNYPGPYCI